MRILLVHNFYGSGSPSGENVVFELERDLLSRHGHEVRTLVRHSDSVRRLGPLGTILGALATPWNPLAAHVVRREVEAFRPDVVHAHNTFPLLSPAVFPAARGAARVLTLHNYRLFCPAAIPLRAGVTCTECLDRRSVLPSLRHGCYRQSRIATAPLALGVALARGAGVWQRHVEAFVALTEFQRDVMVRAGLPADRVWVKPNFYPGSPPVRPWAERRPCAVFVGRLSEEKGVADLVDAWATWGNAAPELRVVGDGPLRASLEARATRGSTRIRFVGRVPPAEAEAEIAAARLVVLPSVWFEGFPLVLRDAFAAGTPAAVSEVGALPSLVRDGRAGIVFRPGDPAALLAAVRTAWETPGALERLGEAARAEFERNYGEEANHALLVGIYEQAIARRRRDLA